MVLHRTSRSSKQSAETASTAPAASSGPSTSEASPTSPPQTTDNSPEKRIRKPSQRMLEALQDDTEGAPEKAVAFVAIGKGKRKETPSSELPSTGGSQSKRLRGAPVAEDSTPEAVLDAFGFATPDKVPRKVKGKRGSDASLTGGDVSSGSSTRKKSGRGNDAKKKGKLLSNRTRSNKAAEDDDFVQEDSSVPSEEEYAEATTETSLTEDDEDDLNDSPSPKQLAKLKIRVPKSVLSVAESDSTDDQMKGTSASKSGPKQTKLLKTVNSKTKKSKKNEPIAEVLPEAERNTDANESSSVFPEEGDASLSGDRRLTARQRAKLYGAEDHLIKLEDPRAKTPPADYLEKKEERNKKRRIQAAERREELKTETVQKLLHKAPSNKKGGKPEGNASRQMVKYVISQQGTTVFYPEGALTMQRMAPISAPLLVKCGVSGCKNARRYSCSKTGLALCSLECYKKHQNRRSTSRVK
ncbi:hypothetical protein BV898_08420 [Hypsibius exemplaris]|uniref:INO80 complex subunit B-like conserved region domain-containing protein n=1 Tax=Hypsibius exemplaris TaxID=2072580 RepID=A0A1W0WQQ6_HYPEX|nr:hypothetical protein BV898_08420 [Hypsibius exemplaris]